MRINQFIARSTGMSRRTADRIITDGRVTINQQVTTPGHGVEPTDVVHLDGQPLVEKKAATIVLNKPVGYVCSRDGQGSKTIYELLPQELHHLKPVGRLDKDSSGLLLMTTDGSLANQLTHPRYQKEKRYEVVLDRPLAKNDEEQVSEGVRLEDGLSKLKLAGNGKNWAITMTEGRNRQIRRTFAALEYRVTGLHRTSFGEYTLNELAIGKYTNLL